MGGAKAEPIQVKSGLKPGDPISLILFNLFLEKVVIETNIQSHEGFKLQESYVKVLVYADDMW